jgi:hypothetical protein
MRESRIKLIAFDDIKLDTERLYLVNDLIPRRGLTAIREHFCICASMWAAGDLDDLFNPAIYFDDGALRIHASPLEWLRANREGIVILRPDLTYAYLQHVRRLFFANARHLRQVRSWIQPPQPRAEFLLETPAEIAE